MGVGSFATFGANPCERCGAVAAHRHHGTERLISP